MLTLKDLRVFVWDKPIITCLNYTFPSGKTTVILGQNGSGKSSLALAIAGHPRYRVEWEIFCNEENITFKNPTERYEAGIFLAFQNIPEIPGIKVREYLRTVYNESFKKRHPTEKTPTAFVFKRMLEKLLPPLSLSEWFLERDLFVGFSGWEKRKIELLQIELLNPEVIILDEIDSGLDIDALSLLNNSIKKWRTNGKTIIIISHNFHLLEKVDVDRVVILKYWQIDRHGEGDIVEEIKKRGFQS